jgi:hypothetical protein
VVKTGFLSSLMVQGEPRGPGYLEQTFGAMMTTFFQQKFDPKKITPKKEINRSCFSLDFVYRESLLL